MRSLSLAAFGGVLAFGLAACGDREAEVTNTTVTTNQAGTMAAPSDGMGMGGSGANMAGGMATGAAAAGTGTAGSWSDGARIVEEGGVSYRVDAAGARVRLQPNESRIVTERGVRYRVDPGGTRVRIDERGAAVRVGDSTITGNAPNGRSDRETPGEAATDVVEDAAEAVSDVVDPPQRKR